MNGNIPVLLALAATTSSGLADHLGDDHTSHRSEPEEDDP